ncbi:hypothetical protein BDV38DRAFT_264806 [Aspergillus pseudotamarii]|uniref:Uncharacterized protein n=1 Tax=Aspergillus pseudotamarii TaxID=132259 RepID=A0A5N6SCC2_ASPPS|nr:uncharacterized protein BDV38DRAFT_264806 [Aspergillus pseudotamarii]KAE8131301.1 hypothetical protein BDV38DRAFT_264806 [Aspergillus pseudotamarii]
MLHPSIVRCIDIEIEEPSHNFQCPRARSLIIYYTTVLVTICWVTVYCLCFW